MADTKLRDEGQKEYINRRFLITGVSFQENKPSVVISYVTTHSAFIFTIRGAAEVSFDTEVMQATPQAVVHGAPGHRVKFEIPSAEPFQHLTIYYDSEIPWHGGSNLMRSVYALPFLPDENTTQLLQDLTKSVQLANWDDQSQRSLLAQQLILSLFGQNTMNQEILRVGQAVSLMQNSFQKNLKLADLAEEAGMTEAHFSYVFHKIYHIRPIDYLIRLRLRKAADLLITGSTVTEAAWRVGYQDPLYFSRLFKKHFGITPSSILRSQSW